jgi:hypothetical protein
MQSVNTRQTLAGRIVLLLTVAVLAPPAVSAQYLGDSRFKAWTPGPVTAVASAPTRRDYRYEGLLFGAIVVGAVGVGSARRRATRNRSRSDRGPDETAAATHLWSVPSAP